MGLAKIQERSRRCRLARVRVGSDIDADALGWMLDGVLGGGSCFPMVTKFPGKKIF